MGPGPNLRLSTLPMKTREIPSYASNHLSRASRVANHSTVVCSREDSQDLRRESSRFLPTEAGHIMARTPPRSIPDAGEASHQIRDHRVEKKNPKNPPSNCLTKALSEIAQEMPRIAVADVTTFAKRSIDARRMEATKAGKVKRPLNAFMLYRKAYQDIAKTQCSRNNHQQVSTICGSSWKSWEPPNVIAHYKQLASIEKQMHEDAFPAYKYDPVQPKKSKDGMNQDPNNCDLSDGETSCRPRRSGRQRTVRGTPRMRPSFALDMPDQYQGLSDLHHQPLGGSWQQYPTLPQPNWYAHGSLSMDSGQYATRGSRQGADEADAGISYSCTSGNLDFQPYTPFIDPCLDPSLQAGVPGSQYGQFLSGAQDMLPDWMNVGGAQNTSASLVPDLDITGTHTAYLQGADGDWQIEQLEDGSQFSDWMMQTGGSSR